MNHEQILVVVVQQNQNYNNWNLNHLFVLQFHDLYAIQMNIYHQIHCLVLIELMLEILVVVVQQNQNYNNWNLNHLFVLQFHDLYAIQMNIYHQIHCLVLIELMLEMRTVMIVNLENLVLVVEMRQRMMSGFHQHQMVVILLMNDNDFHHVTLMIQVIFFETILVSLFFVMWSVYVLGIQ